jgi:putative ABC transport system permease protein
MFKSYVKLALRTLWKHKTSTAINILSLSAGLASCALVFLFVQHELSFDKGFDDSASIYRVVSNFGGTSGAPTVSYRYETSLKSEIPEIAEVSRLDPTNGTTIVQASGMANATPYSEDSGYWVDPNFFDILSFRFLQGDRATALKMPNAIVLSATLAKKLFGQAYSLGHAVKVSGYSYRITGVFKDDFLNHLHPDFLASNKNNQFDTSIAGLSSWVANPNFYTYVKLKPGSNIRHVNAEIEAYTLRHAGPDMKATGDQMTNSLQALSDIHLHSYMYQDYLAYKQGNIQYLYLLGAIASVILLLGCINYMNLSTAQAIGRAREIGVRRVIGAGKKSIRAQFFIETFAISLIALVVAVVFAFLFLPLFNTLTGQQLSFFATENHNLVAWLLGVTVLTALFAGVYPAFYLSSFQPIQVLKGKAGAAKSISGIRQLLIVAQFIISTVLVFATVVIWNQLHLMINTRPGFDRDQQLVLNLNSNEAKGNSELLISQLKSNPHFKSIAGASDPLFSSDLMFYPEGKTIAGKKDLFLVWGDQNYLKTLGLQLISGSNFTPQVFNNTNLKEDPEVHDISRQVILNEEAVKALGLDPYTAPGKTLMHLHEGTTYRYTITGVVKNYHYFSLHAPVGPFAIMTENPKRFGAIVAKVNGRQMSAAIKFAGDKWKSLNPGTPFSYGFLNDLFMSDYIQDEHTQQMSGIFTMIAIVISCLGLLGLVTYSVSQKAAEIGIRKVIGASVASIVMLFAKQYLKLVIIANIIAWPLGWYLMDKWLQTYPYRVSINWWMFAVALSAGVITAFATVIFKTLKAATANPVDSLRAE